MKPNWKISQSWDALVFLAVAGIGLVFTIQRMISPRHAAVAQAELVVTTADPEMVDLGCLDTREPVRPVAAKGDTVRLRGRLCEASAAPLPRLIDGLSVHNRTSGAMGTVFQGRDASFLTGELLLLPGQNRIEVAWEGAASGGPSSRRIEIYRR